MATTPSQRSGSEAAAPATFSYAQAAKGLSAPPSAAASKPTSGSVTPAKDTQITTSPSAAGTTNWADDAEANDTRSETAASSGEPLTAAPVPASKAAATTPQVPTESLLTSPNLSASTASTVTKDDDVSSIPNTSSDSTWENKSQASTSVEKSAESADKPTGKGEGKKGKGKNGERVPAKPLQDAPVPLVNIWKQRAEEAKAKTAQRPAVAKSAPASNGTSQVPPAPAKQTKPATVADNGEAKEKSLDGNGRVDGQHRKDNRSEGDADKTKKTTKGRFQEKESRMASSAQALPSVRDQEAWPTPETAVDEDRKKANEKAEKTEKTEQESKENATAKTKWSKLPINPTVVFNTPIPNGSSSRRGGRGAGRGGAQANGRGFDTNHNPHTEKNGLGGAATLANGDQPKRGRADGPPRDSSQDKRPVSVGSNSKEKISASNIDNAPKVAGFETETASRRPGDSASSTQPAGQHNAYPRQLPPNRSGKGRRGDFSGAERRRDGDSSSPVKENGTFNGRGNTSGQSEATEIGDRRAPAFGEGHATHSKRGGDRQFGGFSGRERGRGGGRGGRGSFQNGHQYGNGHSSSLKGSSTYTGPMSPTFTPDPNAYFAPPQARFRNGPRSQSVSNENMYRMPAPYAGPQQAPPIQTYMNGMYEYPLAQPMSAVPFGQYAMDPFSLFSMVTMQLEYYFSLENLLKDMYLRKHMDAKGFVFLNVIADFNRIKQLTTDIELIKMVCYQSRVIEFRIGSDGKDRLRCREGWEKWVLPVAERDASAQNEGPEETYNPPLPHPHGFDPNATSRYPDMAANEGVYPPMNGFHPGATQHVTSQSNKTFSNGTPAEGINDDVISNGQHIDPATNAVSFEPDSFSDEQVESLTVVVRQHDQSAIPALPSSTDRTFSNGSMNSRSGMSGEPEGMVLNGASPSSGIEKERCSEARRSRNLLMSPETPTPFRLYWVKNNDMPVHILPPDSTHESYLFLRSKALQQRQNIDSGSFPYDMDVLYQFWSHFLIRNFNTKMYDEFRNFALEDATNDVSEIGLKNLMEFYGQSLSSAYGVVRNHVLRDYIKLVQSEGRHQCEAVQQLRSFMHNESLESDLRQRILDLLDPQLMTSFE